MKRLGKRGWILIGLALGCCIALSLAGYLVFLSLQTSSQVTPQWTVLAYPATPTFGGMDTPVTNLESTEILPSPSPSILLDKITPPIPTQPIAVIQAVKSSCLITESGGLVTEIRAITGNMPGPGSNGMVAPTEAQMAAWEIILKSMLDEDTKTACNLIQDNKFPYHIVDFTDLPFNRERYRILKEDQPVTVGWGTYVIRTEDVLSEVVVEAPHPIADERTELEGVEIFRQMHARALLVAGTNRCANQAYSPCSGKTMACGQLEPYRTSDAGHATQTMFQAAHQALVTCGGERVALQLHGNDLASCPDVFVSNGTLFPHELSSQIFLQTVKSCSPFTIDLAEGKAVECAFNNGASVQAVYSNGCARSPDIDACTDYVGQPSNPEQFISIEQSSRLRQNYGCFLDALKDVWSKP